MIQDAIDNEKDPRNILKMFSLIEKVNLKFFKNQKNLNKENEEDFINTEVMSDLNKSFFETLEIYYPIEFTPPKNSKENITTNDLINALNNAFASNDSYMEYLLELLKGKKINFNDK